MRLASEFIKLPLSFDIARLQHELAQFQPSEWIPHPNHIEGNNSIPLISAGGGVNDTMSGEMNLTQALLKSPYLQQVIDSFGEVFGRSRLMSLDASCEVPEHCDMHYHWFDRVRIHIPIITNPKVIFHCGGESVHMAAGEAWLFDSWKMHRVTNDSSETRVHLVLDTCGSAKFWQMVAQSEYFPSGKAATLSTRTIPYLENKEVKILTEKYNTSAVMSPGEVNYLVQDLIDDAKSWSANDSILLQEFVSRADNFRKDWRKVWSLYGSSGEGLEHFQQLIHTAAIADEQVRLGSIDISAQMVFYARVLVAAIDQNIDKSRIPPPVGAPGQPLVEDKQQNQATTSSVSASAGFVKAPEQSLSRNSPCPCGSNKKYKHCCG